MTNSLIKKVSMTVWIIVKIEFCNLTYKPFRQASARIIHLRYAIDGIKIMTHGHNKEERSEGSKKTKHGGVR
ncbi:hypothetical protein [Psychrobacter sp. KH172YL61]|uniref:hypothetical protein n=1 Tax=Psychrobacter sp. KH172YL61 TaxID=2517899 RepID=UPI001F08145C|nr:hypothetical protein [Psychrobacter sp. KH172YL61]